MGATHIGRRRTPVLGLALALLVATAGPVWSDPAETPPTTMVIFGATGDLAKRKVFASLAASWKAGNLPRDFHIVAAARDSYSRDEYLAYLREGVSTIAKVDVESDAWKAIESRIEYRRVDLADPASVRGLGRRLDAIDAGAAPGKARQRLLYLAVTPSVLEPAVRNLGDTKLLDGSGPGSAPLLLVEKPFGRDVASAKRLNRLLAGHIAPERVMRMDHYLGKPAIDDLRRLRRQDAALEAAWNGKYIARVEISASEKIGIEGRGEFYEETGALRDFVQGHLLQKLVVTAMEPAGRRTPGQAKTDVVRALRRLDIAQDVVRGQYEGYLDEPGVAADSKTETYVALTAHIENKRWRGVPFLLESGKGLAEKRSSIRVHFRRLPSDLAARYGVTAGRPAVLEVEVDPVPGISLESGGRRFQLAGGDGAPRPDPYDRLLVAAMRGDNEVFVGDVEVERTWAWLRPLQSAWRVGKAPLARYARGAGRPQAAEHLFGRFTRPARMPVATSAGRQPLRKAWNPSARANARSAQALRRHGAGHHPWRGQRARARQSRIKAAR